jgi:hypothetical protein
MLPPTSAGIFTPSSRIIRTRSRPFDCVKYPASKTTLSLGAARSPCFSSSRSSCVKRKTPAEQSLDARSISSRMLPPAEKSAQSYTLTLCLICLRNPAHPLCHMVLSLPEVRMNRQRKLSSCLLP